MIKIYKNIVTEEEIDIAMEILKNIPDNIWRQSDCTDDPVDQVREYLPQYVSAMLDSIYKRKYIEIVKDFGANIVVPNSHNYAVDRRRVGDYLGPHADIPTGTYDRHRGSSPEDSLITISAIFYFNDDFEGGELRFIEEDRIYKPVKGDLMVFLPTIRHEILEIKKGERYSSQFFYSKPGAIENPLKNVNIKTGEEYNGSNN